MDKSPIEIAIGQTNILIEDEVCKAVGRAGIHINKEELLKALKAYEFVEELTNYIFEYPDDDYMTMECLCRKLVKHGLLDKVDGYYQTHEIRTNTHECVKDTHDKTYNSSEKPNNSTISKMEQVEDEPQRDCFLCKWLGEVDVCGRCRNRNLFCEAELQPRCPNCGKRGYIRSLESMGVKLKHFDEYKWKCTNCNKYFKEEPKDEPQTEREGE